MICALSELMWKSVMVVSGHGTFQGLWTKSSSDLLKSPKPITSFKRMSILSPPLQGQLHSQGSTINLKLGWMGKLPQKIIQNNWSQNQAESPNFMQLPLSLKKEKLWSSTLSRRFQINHQTSNSRLQIPKLKLKMLNYPNKSWRRSPNLTKISSWWSPRMIGSKSFTEISQTIHSNSHQLMYPLKDKFLGFLLSKN